jgi:hypothetical protein
MKGSILRDIRKIVTPKFLSTAALKNKFRQRLTSQINESDFFKMLILQVSSGHALNYSNLNATLRSINSKVKISNQALAKYFYKQGSADLMKAAYERVFSFQKEKLNNNDISLGSLNLFNRILLQDSTICTLNEKLIHQYRGSGGSASKSSLKIDVIHELKTAQLLNISISPGYRQDYLASESILAEAQENDLIIRDLGYSKLDVFVQMEAKKIFFISRLNPTQNVYLHQDDETPTKLTEYLNRKHKDQAVIDLVVYLGKKKEKIRLITYRVSSEVSNQRRRKAKRTATRQGRTASEASLARCDFVILITNIPSEKLEAKIIGTIYRIRWSIELIFKAWKSQLKLQISLKGYRGTRIDCFIYAILIVALLTTMVHQWLKVIGIDRKDKEISFERLVKWLVDTNAYSKLLWGRGKQIEEELIEDQRNIRKQKRNRKTTLQRIIDCESYEEKYLLNF